MFMISGSDYFEDLVDAGIVEDRHQIPRELAEETWRRVGVDILDAIDEMHVGYRPPESPIWAERTFGPAGRRRLAA